MPGSAWDGAQAFRVGSRQLQELGPPPSGAIVFVGLGRGVVEPRELEKAAVQAAEALRGTTRVLLVEAPELVWARAVGEGAGVERAWRELHEALSRAGAWAAGACERGLGLCWGVSSEAFVYPLQGRRLLELRELSLPEGQRPQVVELPLNLLEPTAVTKGIVRRAAEKGLKVLASRVLTGLMGSAVIDLQPIEAPSPPSPGALARALERLEGLEGPAAGLGRELGQWLEELVGPRLWQARAKAVVERLGGQCPQVVEEVLAMGLAIQQAAAAAVVRRLLRLLDGLGVETAGRDISELAAGLVGAVEGVWGVVVAPGRVQRWEAMGPVEGLWEELEAGLEGLGSELGRVG